MLGVAGDRLAIWQTSPTGYKSGAWTFDRPPDRAQARLALALVERRAVAGTDRDEDLRILRQLTDAADVPFPTARAEHWVDLRRVHLEIAAVRDELDKAVENSQHTATAKPQPLAYHYDVAVDPLPADLTDALAFYRLVQPRSDAEPAAIRALSAANLLGPAVTRWQDTETARLRRDYLRSLGGNAARPLPPRWLGHLTAMYPVTFDL